MTAVAKESQKCHSMVWRESLLAWGGRTWPREEDQEPRSRRVATGKLARNENAPSGELGTSSSRALSRDSGLALLPMTCCEPSHTASPPAPWDNLVASEAPQGLREPSAWTGQKSRVKCHKLSCGMLVKKSLHLYNSSNFIIGVGKHPAKGKKRHLDSTVFFRITLSPSPTLTTT